MRDLEYREAMIWASGEHLAHPFPDNWEELDDDVLMQYIADNVYEATEFFEPEYVWSLISCLCSSVNQLIAGLKHED